MKRPVEIEREEQAMQTLAELTHAFEGIASMRIAQIKNQVQQSTQFFYDLWGIYTQLRVSEEFGFGRAEAIENPSDKELFVIITSEGGFSGDIDHKLVKYMLSNHDPTKQDIVVVGHHGAIQLAQRGISYEKYFKLPTEDQNINVAPIIKEIQRYKLTNVFYQEYISLMVQDVRRIELSNVVQQIGNKSDAPDEIITEANYIFEPSAYAVVAHLERSMMGIALSQLILNSKLAQYASRFRAMTESSQRATDARDDLHLDYNRAKRAIKDERLKEIINGIKKSQTGAVS